MRLAKQIECLVFRKNPEGKYEFLLLKRNKKKGGFWQPVTGGIETEDKSKKERVIQEIFEETGITKDKILRIIEDIHYFEFSDPDPTEEYVFAAEVNNDVKVNINQNIYPEHDEYKWLPYDEAEKLLIWDNNKTALEKLNKIITK